MLNEHSRYIANNIKIERHPIHCVRSILGSALTRHELHNTKLTLSEYVYTPQSLNDERKEFQIPISKLTDKDMLIELDNLRSGVELAFHSTVNLANEILHIPMIDFGNKKVEALDIKPLKELASYWNLEFYVFDSGRSFHAYGNRLLNDSDWIKFMGSLLLLNIPGRTKLIDTRWVGHRILAGYSSLRWSNNTRHYKRFPAFSGSISNHSFNDNIYDPSYRAPPSRGM